MFEYFLFDGTMSINGADPETVIRAFRWTKSTSLWFIAEDGEIKYNVTGNEDAVRNFIANISSPTEPEEDSLQAAKRKKIEESKSLLDRYLCKNPLASVTRNRSAQNYAVTMDKQYRLTSTLLNALLAQQLGCSYDIIWNASGNPGESWSFDELATLALQINAYVRPFILEQQYVEMAIQNCSDFQSLLNINIDYQNCPYKRIHRF